MDQVMKQTTTHEPSN